MRVCIDCTMDISDMHTNAKRCTDCQRKYREFYKKQFKYDRRDIYSKSDRLRHDRNRLGNPEQDKEILNFLKKKRNWGYMPLEITQSLNENIKYNFSYNEFENFLTYAKTIAPLVSFRESVERNEKCIILRHDVDLDFYPSYEMSRIEKKIGIHSTFFILLSAPSYNPQSLKIRTLIRKMVEDGFEIGLHFDPTIYGPISHNNLLKKVQNECQILTEITGETIRSIALHNPSVSGEYPIFEGYINAYSKEFFCDERYLSDSMRVDPSQHPYRGKELYEFIRTATNYPLQIVLHPEQFLEKGGDYVDTITRYNQRVMTDIMHDYIDTLTVIRRKKVCHIK